MVSVLIAGGGTGGHVFPMLAVGQAVRRVAPASEVFYVGTARGLEARAVPEAGGELELLDVAPLRGGGISGFFRGSFKAAWSLEASRKLVARRRPDVVLSVGGYAGGPVALAARLMGVPLAILEPNSVLGLTNRLLAPFASRAYLAFGDLDTRFGQGIAKRLGVPLRSAFEASPYVPEAERFRVLVLGGSLGARALNSSIPAGFAAVLRDVPHASIVHQVGRGHLEAASEAWRVAGLEGDPRVRVTEFIGDVATELRGADVVVQRAGASSLAELCVVGRASVLVPFPFAADQHQLGNARSLEAIGAALAIEQSDATSDRLARELLALANDPARRVAMANAARGYGKPDAAVEIARDLLSIARSTSPSGARAQA
jgi:UDP-N-acetylglucosamine--N-acetylmuramyl-(pentapeptide) pyrophosphoryl-undecaprenol N-acetylglucosamine transferase